MSDWIELRALAQDLTLLVVDDDPDVLCQLQQLLGRIFGQVLSAADGDEALAIYQQVGPDELDLIVSDIHMPHKNGLDLARAIREQNTDIKILLVSAYNETHYFLQALEINVDGFLIKPVQPQPLVKTLIKLCRIIQDRRARLLYQQSLEEERRLVACLIQGMLKHHGLEDPAITWHLQPAEMIVVVFFAVERNLDTGQLYAFLADATGHGLPAAVHLLPLHRIFHSMASQGYSLGKILIEMNQALYDVNPGDRFVAATLIKFDFSDGLLEIWNGGNPPALLFNQQGQLRHQFSSRHLALGVIDTSFDAACEHYFSQPGEALFIFSDGVLDATNAKAQRWGRERLLTAYQQASSISCSTRRLQSVIQALQAYVGSTSAIDDVSLLQIQLNPLA